MRRITVRFHGDLKQFGDNFKLHADSANEALHSLMCQIDGLRNHIKKGWYELRVGNRVKTEEDLKNGIDLRESDIVHLTPKTIGAGKFGTFIAGAVLVAVGAIGFAAGWGTPFIQAGVGLMIGGVAQMLVRQPSFNENHMGVEDSKSSAFSNLSNITGQGKQIPRAYGEIRAGSVIISQDMSSYRPNSGEKISGIEKPTYTKKRINVIHAQDKNGDYIDTDINDESVQEAAVTIVTNWSK